MNTTTKFSIAVGAVLLSWSAKGGNWPQWRGPHFDGSTLEVKLPEVLDLKENLAWSTELPGPSCATPVVFGDRIFLTAVDSKTKKLLALCASKSDGKILWSKEVGEGSVKNNRNDLASPSPITDGKSVWFYYGSGDLAAFDVEGKPLWARNVEKEFGAFHMQWLSGATPLLHAGKLYVPVLHRDRPIGARQAPEKLAESYLLCVDAISGKDAWRVVRPTDAVMESQEAYTTPIPIDVGGKTQIVIVGGDHVTGHDAESGKEIWRSPNYNPRKDTTYRTVTSGCSGEGLIFASPPKGGAMFAVKPTDGSSADAEIAWKNPEVTTDVCAPLFYMGSLYVLDGDRKKLYNLDPKTGVKKWTAEVGGSKVFRTSLTGADGKFYCMNEGGDVWVLSAEDGKVLSQISLGSEGAARSTIVVSEGRVFIRTADRLYAFGK